MSGFQLGLFWTDVKWGHQLNGVTANTCGVNSCEEGWNKKQKTKKEKKHIYQINKELTFEVNDNEFEWTSTLRFGYTELMSSK